MTRVPAAPVVVVNNSQETFSATSSGAIATCIHELCLAAGRRGEHPVVVTSDRAGDPLPWDDVRYVRPPATRVDSRIRRALCHLAGWERPGQRAFARRTLAEIRRIGAKVVVCNNDPEIAAYLSHRLPDATVVHWFHNLMITSGRGTTPVLGRRRVAVGGGQRLPGPCRRGRLPPRSPQCAGGLPWR